MDTGCLITFKKQCLGDKGWNKPPVGVIDKYNLSSPFPTLQPPW